MKTTNIALSFAAVALLIGAGGCNRTGAKAANRVSDYSQQWSDDLFKFAIANLNHLESNDCQEMMRSTQARLTAIAQPELAPGVAPSNALLASWPEPDMLRQVVSRLNQWVDTLEKPKPWTPDPMLAKLPPEFAKLPMLTELEQPHFTAYDGYMLMEAVWCRDVTRWAKGETSDDLLAARNLFDWTIRNIQLDYDGPDHLPQVPWETLFLGHGTPLERAWTYILLLRQCDIDAAIVALPKNADSKSLDMADLKPWCVAVLVGEKEKKLYLFDTHLGLPIPAANGVRADKSGRLEILPTTLDQVAAHPELLDRLALGSDEPYWVKKDNADLKRPVLLVEASPLYLEPRAKRVQFRLTGADRMALNAEPSAQAARFKATGVADVRLWEMPYATLQRRLALKPMATYNCLAGFFRFIGFGAGSLYQGRILHLKGRFFDESGAIAFYQKSRPRTRDVLAEEQKRAQGFYRWRKDQIEAAGHKVTPDLDQRLKHEAATIVTLEMNSILQGKIDAAYWLGLIEYEQDQYESAIDYFVKRTLQAGHDMVWAAGAHYNIGRCEEMTGEWREAAQEYVTTLELRNEAGNLLRAKWLKEIHAAKPEEKKAEVKAAKDKKAENKPETKKTEDNKETKAAEKKP